MDQRLARFVERHAESTSACVAAAVRAVQKGEVYLRGVSEGVSSSELASIYAVRSGTAAKQGRHAVAAEMLRLSSICEANACSACSVWMLEGSTQSYAIFELMPSYVIGGCFAFSGSVWAEHNGA